MERDIVLVVVGGLIGLASSLATLLVVYLLEGMRLRRQWAREDQLLMRQKRDELQNLLTPTAERQPGSRPAGRPAAPLEQSEAE